MRSQLVYSTRRYISSNWTFQKGKLTLQKLKDKSTIDETINQVNVVFPDQFGRLTGLKLNAEYFADEVEKHQKQSTSEKESLPFFEYKYNPFRFDVQGKPITFDDDVKLSKSIRLVPDLDTLREQPWLSKEAVVMADVYDIETDKKIKFAPRNLMKETINQLNFSKDLDQVKSQIMFSFVLHKLGKEEKDQHHNSHKGMLTLEQGWGEVLDDCKKSLHNIGIPVQAKDQTHINNQFRFHLRQVQGNLLSQCDMFHLGKHAMKFIGYTHQYDISSLPIDSSKNPNDLILNLEGMEIHPSVLQNILYFAPNINSVRRLRDRKNGDIFKQKGEQSYEIAISAPDVNLYLALSNLLKTQPNHEKALKIPRNYEEALGMFEEYKDNQDSEVYNYYHQLFKHEQNEFNDFFTKWEVNRIY
ncbi:UNKNOWN [Stylonychia lemnae]|uniref:Uncharacterized protein n=1 Tax=Stylonychia lemnae TaxID=5949 RepID=A0A078AFI9_STYLE|nr:UNKNOWN [Stylonychia lemnae]|eukprot:CDW80282.1 UNKNOWN [Stylonychia lemnae]